MNRLLFVYGSLLTVHDHPQGRRLRQEALLLGPAIIAGRLYRISWYPGLTEPVAATDLVHGEVYELSNPARALTWLDEYEGITQGAFSVVGRDDYARVERTVIMANGEARSTWAYLYQLTAPPAAQVPDGRWRG